MPEIDSQTKEYLAERATEIKHYAWTTVSNVLNIGSILTEVKAKVKHGEFTKWLKAEFQWSTDTAQNYMRVFKLSENRSPSVFENITLEALYKIAAPKVAPAAKKAVLDAAATGKHVSAEVAKDIIEDANRRTAPPTEGEDMEDTPTPKGKTKGKKSKEKANQWRSAFPRHFRNQVLKLVRAYEKHKDHRPIFTLIVVRDDEGKPKDIQINEETTTNGNATRETSNYAPVN